MLQCCLLLCAAVALCCATILHVPSQTPAFGFSNMVELKPSSPSSGTNRKRASSAPDVSIDQAAVTSPPSASATTPSNTNGGGVAFSPSTNLPPAGSSPASRSPSSPARFAAGGGTGGPRTPGLESPTHGSSDGVSNALPSVTQSLPPKLAGMGKK